MTKIFSKHPATRYRRMEARLNRGMGKHADIVMRSVLKSVRFNLNNVILKRRTSRLYNSFVGRISKIRDGLRVTIGSPVVYSKIHDTGGMAGRNRAVHIPKRNYFRLAFVRSRSVLKRELKNYLAEVFR